MKPRLQSDAADLCLVEYEGCVQNILAFRRPAESNGWGCCWIEGRLMNRVLDAKSPAVALLYEQVSKFFTIRCDW